jgi:hypothetical protein
MSKSSFEGEFCDCSQQRNHSPQSGPLQQHRLHLQPSTPSFLFTPLVAGIIAVVRSFGAASPLFSVTALFKFAM